MPIFVIIAGLTAALQAPAAPTSVTCSVTGDPAGRVYRLSKAEAGQADAASRGGRGTWRIALRTRETPAWIELELPGAAPVITATSASLSYTNANGGRQVTLDVDPDRARLEVWVDHGLEVNVDPDLDPRVDRLTTGGPLTSLACTIDGSAK